MIRLGGEKEKKGFLMLSWATYDLANQFFALNIVSLYFPRWINIERNQPEIFYGLAFGVSMFLVAIFAPFLGAISDAKNKRRVFLIFFTLLSIIFTMSLSLPVSIFLALVFFAIANFGCQVAIIFYNALMIRVTPKGRIGFVSGLGRMFGYTGAILALYLTKP
ncbi:MAG: MFS transporter, partial [Candidatus Omnitrophota bacterium]